MGSSCSLQQANFLSISFRRPCDIVSGAKVRGYADLRPEMSRRRFLRQNAQSDSGGVNSICLRSTSSHGCVAFRLKNPVCTKSNSSALTGLQAKLHSRSF